MIFLWILGVILLLLVFLLFVGVKIHISYKDDLALFVSVLGIRIPILPKRKKKINHRQFSYKRHRRRLLRESKAAQKKERKRILKENKKKIKSTQKKGEKKKLPPDDTSSEKEPSVTSVLLSVVSDVLEKFFGTLGVEVVRIRITVGGPDATATALAYGAAAQGVAYLLELLANKTAYRRKKAENVSVAADFLSRKTTADVSLVFTLRVWNLLRVAFVFLSKFIKEKIRRASVQT